MRIVQATIGHVNSVLQDLSDQNKAEHDMLGLDQFTVLRLARDFMKDGVAYTALYAGKPVFVLGLVYEDGENRTWFLATKEYFSLGLRALLHGRRFLQSIAKAHGKIVTGSCSPHPDAVRWFEVLGYKKLDEIDGVKWFVYDAPSSKASVRPEIAAPGSLTKAADDVLRRWR